MERAAVAVSALSVILLCGCGDGRPATVPLTGRVTYNGNPLSIGQIVFAPRAGRSAFGEIRDSQIVDVTTFSKGDGVIPGPARVGITCITNMKSINGPHEPMIPTRYFEPDKSGLTFEVSADGPNEYVIDLKD